MHVVIAGGHGKIALRLTALLAGRTDRVTSIIRNPAHRADVEQAGGAPVVLDLETTTVDDLAPVLRDADAAVFAAGPGPAAVPPAKTPSTAPPPSCSPTPPAPRARAATS